MAVIKRKRYLFVCDYCGKEHGQYATLREGCDALEADNWSVDNPGLMIKCPECRHAAWVRSGSIRKGRKVGPS
jgi:hypothetical protein